MRAQRIVASFSTLAQYGTYFFIHLFISISVSYKENKWSSRKGNALFSIMKQIFFIFLIMTFFFFFLRKERNRYFRICILLLWHEANLEERHGPYEDEKKMTTGHEM